MRLNHWNNADYEKDKGLSEYSEGNRKKGVGRRERLALDFKGIFERVIILFYFKSAFKSLGTFHFIKRDTFFLMKGY